MTTERPPSASRLWWRVINAQAEYNLAAGFVYAFGLLAWPLAVWQIRRMTPEARQKWLVKYGY